MNLKGFSSVKFDLFQLKPKMSRRLTRHARPIHPEDPLEGREWGRECFICDELSFMGPSFICVESHVEPLFSCARCRRADAQPDAKRIQRHVVSPLLSTPITWREYSPVLLSRQMTSDDSELPRLARAGLDAFFRAQYESLLDREPRGERVQMLADRHGAGRPRRVVALVD